VAASETIDESDGRGRGRGLVINGRRAADRELESRQMRYVTGALCALASASKEQLPIVDAM
jgi:hypothetical protein